MQEAVATEEVVRPGPKHVQIERPAVGADRSGRHSTNGNSTLPVLRLPFRSPPDLASSRMSDTLPGPKPDWRNTTHSGLSDDNQVVDLVVGMQITHDRLWSCPRVNPRTGAFSVPRARLFAPPDQSLKFPKSRTRWLNTPGRDTTGRGSLIPVRWRVSFQGR